MSTSARPGPLTLVAFSIVCLVGGSNFVAVRFSNRELPPFYGAGIRFVAASALLFAIVAVTRKPLPRGHQWAGPVAFGLLSFFLAYALFYWAAQQVPAAYGGLLFGTVPLSTFAFAVLHRVERFRTRALVGAAIAIGGIVVMAGAPSGNSFGVLYLLAAIASTIGAAEGAVLLKRFPAVHPFMTNAISMGIGGVLLLATSVVFGEAWIVPQLAATRWTLLFLVPIGSVGLFILYTYVLQHWTASGASYQFVFFPPVSAIGAALLLDEPLSWKVAAGVTLVIAGTYVGALAPTSARVPSDRSV
jgi:drug/metabolite transporter (DMT)-like permease